MNGAADFVRMRFPNTLTLCFRATFSPFAVRYRHATASALHLPQYPYEHGPKRPVLLAVDQQLGKFPALWIAPELADPVGTLEVREHQDVKQLGAGSRTEGVEALTPVEGEQDWWFACCAD